MSTSDETAEPGLVTLDGLDLAALIASRVCHDVISPVGAIVNGLELLDDDRDGTMREFAFELIRSSAAQASARLQFCRIAFGAAGSAAAVLDLGDAEQVARGFIEDKDTKIDWRAPRRLLPKNQVKLLLNLALVASATIPHGGVIEVTDTGEGETADFRLLSTGAPGKPARVPTKLLDLLAGRAPENRVDAHIIQPFYTGLLAKAAGMTVTVETEGEAVAITARPAAG